MKTLIRILVLTISFPFAVLASPVGICLHAYSPEAPPDKIECFEFEKFEIISNGKRFFLKNDQTVVVTTYRNRGEILYPGNSPDLAGVLENYETRARLSPSTRPFLNPWIQKIRTTLAEAPKQAQAVSEKPSMTTTDGKTYTDVTITKVDPDGIRIMHESGSAKIPFEKLSESLRIKYGYDVAKATEFRRLQEAKDQAAEKVIEASIPKIEASAADRKETPMTKFAFEKLPDATQSAMSGPLEANMVYQFTGSVSQVTEKFLLVQDSFMRQPFSGMLVFGDPKKVGNIAIESGPGVIQFVIRFKQFKDLTMADDTAKRVAVFDCLGFFWSGNKYIDTTAPVIPKE